MTETVKNQMFDAFFTTKEAGEGTGFGMSIAYGIIKKHQGQIEVESESGKGTIITLLLPWTPELKTQTSASWSLFLK